MATAATNFGQRVDGYAIPVFNERAVRAAAGLQFLWVSIGLTLAVSSDGRNLSVVRSFALAFSIDMALRLFVDTNWSPFLRLSGLLVRGQTPEWVGAPQKRWAWSLGLALSMATCFAFGRLGLPLPIALTMCGACALMLFLETALGICVGCVLHQRLAKEQTLYCPGDVCSKQGRP